MYTTHMFYKVYKVFCTENGFMHLFDFTVQRNQQQNVHFSQKELS